MRRSGYAQLVLLLDSELLHKIESAVEVRGRSQLNEVENEKDSGRLEVQGLRSGVGLCEAAAAV